MITMAQAIRYWGVPLPRHVLTAANVISPDEVTELRLSGKRDYLHAAVAYEDRVSEDCGRAARELAERMGAESRKGAR